MKPESKPRAHGKPSIEHFLELGIPEEWVEPLQELGYDTVEKIKAEKARPTPPENDGLAQEKLARYRHNYHGTGCGVDLLMIYGILIGLFLFLSGPAMLAQAQDSDHIHHLDIHPKNEIGVGNSLSYLVGERELAYALHVHYLRSLEKSRFSAGIGYEQIFDEHRHRSLSLIGAFNPVSSLILSLAPGILLGTQEKPGFRFALHTEAVYEFEIRHFHLGPALEFATTFDEYHIGVGIHIAFTFP